MSLVSMHVWLHVHIVVLRLGRMNLRSVFYDEIPVSQGTMEQ